MAINWNSLTGRPSRKTHTDTTGRDSGITADEVKHIVGNEVRAASMKNQVIHYMEDVNAQSIRTEALLGEIKDVIDTSLLRINEAVTMDATQVEKIDEINSSIVRLEALSSKIETSIAKQMEEEKENPDEVLDSIDKVSQEIEHLIQMNREIEESVHKDNLVSYKNLKTMLDAMESNNVSRHKKLSGIVSFNLILTLLNLLITAFWVYIFLTSN